MYITLIGLKQRGREKERKVVILRVKILPKSHDFFLSVYVKHWSREPTNRLTLEKCRYLIIAFLSIKKLFNEHRTYVKAMKICVYYRLKLHCKKSLSKKAPF